MDVRNFGVVDRQRVEQFCRESVKVVPFGARVAARVLGKYNLMLDTSDLSVAMPLALDGYWEMWMTQCVIRSVQAGWNAIDVGAAFGYYTFLLADLVGPNGLVEAWEPNPQTSELLELSLAMNGDLAKRITTRRLAASSESNGLAQLFIPSAHNVGGTRIVSMNKGGTMDLDVSARPVAIAEAAGYRSAATKRLDETELERVDFVKIDAEGHEEQIWDGMTGLFERGEPKCILMEFTPSAYRDAREFLRKIEGTGYRILVVTHDQGFVPADLDAVAGQADWVPLWLSNRR